MPSVTSSDSAVAAGQDMPNEDDEEDVTDAARFDEQLRWARNGGIARPAPPNISIKFELVVVLLLVGGRFGPVLAARRVLEGAAYVFAPVRRKNFLETVMS